MPIGNHQRQEINEILDCNFYKITEDAAVPFTRGSDIIW
jgi:hypothetical protein